MTYPRDTAVLGVQIVGRDDIGLIAESGGFYWYLTDCCEASAKGSFVGCEPAVVCRKCYCEVDPRLGDLPTVTDELRAVAGDDRPTSCPVCGAPVNAEGCSVEMAHDYPDADAADLAGEA